MSKLKVLVSKDFWDDALLRGIRTFFQAALAYVGVTVVSVTEIDYVGAASIGAGAGLISIAQSIIRSATAKIEEEPVSSEVEEDEAILEEVVDEAIESNKGE